MPEKVPDPSRFLITPRKLVQTFAERYDVDMARLELPETAILVPVVPLFMKLTRVLKGEPMTAWKWKSPLFHEFALGEGKKGVLACCPIGAPNVAIAIEELAAFGVRFLYFFGFAGGIGEKVSPGTLVLPHYAHVGEGTTRYYKDGPLSFADGELLEAVKCALETETGETLTVCPVWTTDALYREGRTEVERFARMGVCGVDMEVSAVFSVAKTLSVRAVALLWISDLLSLEDWKPHFHQKALRDAIDRYARAFVVFLQKGER